MADEIGRGGNNPELVKTFRHSQERGMGQRKGAKREKRAVGISPGVGQEVNRRTFHLAGPEKAGKDIRKAPEKKEGY